MKTDPRYAEEMQKLGLGAEVTLFEVDLTELGGPIELFTPMAEEGNVDGAVMFGGQAYIPFPITADGFSWNGQSAAQQPSVTIANIDHAFTGYVLQYGGLIGAQFRRIRTFERFLDTGAEPDADAHLPIDIYRFERKTVHNDTMIRWDLANWIDQQGVMLPKRMVIRDYCDLTYRRWNSTTGDFDYSKATCPYTHEAVAITSITRASNVATATTSVAHGLTKGRRVRVSGNSAVNLTNADIISAPSATTFTFASIGANTTGTGGVMTPYLDQVNSGVTTGAEDRCPHTLKACKMRFGTAKLPFGGFPGVAKFRT